MGTRWIAGSAPAVTIALAAALMAAGCASSLDPVATRYSDDRDYAAPVAEIRIADDAGSIKIAVSGEGATTVHRDLRYYGTRPGSTVRTDGDALVLNGCGADCTVDYVLAVPRGTRVDGSVGSGSVELAGVASVDLAAGSGQVQAVDVTGAVRAATSSGSVDVSAVGSAQLSSGSGSITADDVAGALSARAQSGSVTATGLRGAADVHSASGSVTVSVAVAQDVDAEAVNGTVTVTVPAGPYRVSAHSGNGSAQVDPGVRADPAAAHGLTARSGNGDVRVRAATV